MKNITRTFKKNVQLVHNDTPCLCYLMHEGFVEYIGEILALVFDISVVVGATDNELFGSVEWPVRGENSTTIN